MMTYPEMTITGLGAVEFEINAPRGQGKVSIVIPTITPGTTIDYLAKVFLPTGSCGSPNFPFQFSGKIKVPKRLSNLEAELVTAQNKVDLSWDPGVLGENSNNSETIKGYSISAQSIRPNDDGTLSYVDIYNFGDEIPADATSASIENIIRGLTYNIEVRQTRNNPIGQATNSAVTAIEVPLLESWKFKNFSAIPKPDEDKVELNWTDPSAVSTIKGATDQWYYKIYQYNLPFGPESQKPPIALDDWDQLGEDLGIDQPDGGVTAAVDANINWCGTRLYRLELWVDKGDFSAPIYSELIEVDYPRPIEPIPPSPANVIVTKEDDCSTDVEITWDKIANPHPCQIYWYKITRTELDDDDNPINETLTTLAAGNQITETPPSGYRYIAYNQPPGKSFRYEVMTQTDNIIGKDKAENPIISSEDNRIVDVSISGPLSITEGLSVSLTQGANGFVELSWTDGLPNEDHFILIREAVNQQLNDTEEFELDPNTITYRDRIIAPNGPVVCTDYRYSLKAVNACEEKTIGSVIETPEKQKLILKKDLTDTYLPGDLSANKGYENDFVRLTWRIDKNANSLTEQLIFRKPANSTGDSVLIASIKGLTTYDDTQAPANALQKYYIVGVAECGLEPLFTNQLTDIGFRNPSGIISGKVEYEGGVAVDSCQILGELSGASLNRSLQLDGIDDYIDVPIGQVKVGDVNLFSEKNARTIELWARVDEFNGAALWSYGSNGSKGKLALRTPAPGSQSWTIDLGGGGIMDVPLTVNPGEWHHFALTYVDLEGMDTLRLYIDGVDTMSTGAKLLWTEQNLNTTVSDGDFLSMGNAPGTAAFLKGHVEEIRFWASRRTIKEINAHKNGFLRGNEEGLAIYYRVDEDYGAFLYDRAFDSGGNYFKRDAVLIGGADMGWSTMVPPSDQLGYNALTNDQGNYRIEYVQYTGNGSTLDLVPFVQNHQFRPRNKTVFIGPNNPVLNDQNFEDISSFKVTGRVVYGLDNNKDDKFTDGINGPLERYCPSEGLFVKVDGEFVIQDGQAAMTDANGNFVINVPIGKHFISLEKNGHEFGIGRFPLNENEKWDFQQPVTGLDFVDTTRFTVIGMVVGGTREAAKQSGFDLAKNNVGQATLVFESDCGIGGFKDTVTTDPVTGEYLIRLFPLNYTLRGGVNNDPDIFIASNQVLELRANDRKEINLTTAALQTEKLKPEEEGEEGEEGKSVSEEDLPEIKFHFRRDIIVRNQHSLFVLDPQTKQAFAKGEEELIFTDNSGVTTPIPGNAFPYPVFLKGKEYTLLLRVTEVYENMDEGKMTKDTVPVSDAEIIITNNLAKKINEKLTIDEVDGKEYTFFGGDPEFSTNPGNSALNFVKNFNVVSKVGDTDFQEFNLEAYLLGFQLDGTDFVTVSGPEVPEFILRDPPGSHSYASLSTGEKVSSNMSWRLVGNIDASVQGVIYAGISFQAGLGISIENAFENTLTLAGSVKTKIGGGGTYQEEISWQEDVRTGPLPYQVGADQDIFIGKAKNLNFGSARYLQVIPAEHCSMTVPCTSTDIPIDGNNFRIGVKPGVTVEPSGYDTYFIYTQEHIKNNLIPKLKLVRNALFDNNPNYTSNVPLSHPYYGSNNDDPRWGTNGTPPPSSLTPLIRELVDFNGPSYTFTKTFDPSEPVEDSIRTLNQQIRIWEGYLELNEMQKVNANKEQSTPAAGNIGALGPESDHNVVLIDQEISNLNKNVSISGGPGFTRTVNLSNSVTNEVVWEVYLSSTLAFKIGGKVNGIGAESNSSLTVGMTQSGVKSTGITSTRSYQVHLEDRDIGDSYSIDILDGGDQNGPIFKVQGGETSCPHEGAVVTQFHMPGTILQESTVPRDMPNISISPPTQFGIPSDEAAVFTITLKNENANESRTYQLMIDDESNQRGAILSIDGQDPNRTFSVPAGGSINKILTLRKSPNFNEFNDIKLILKSTCDKISREALLSASFIPTCSKSEFSLPKDNWVLNTRFNDTLPIRLSGYDVNFTNFESLAFFVKPSNSDDWGAPVQEFFNKENALGDTLLLNRNLPYTDFRWGTGLKNGHYDIKLVSYCDNGAVNPIERESAIFTGIIDKKRPHIFGAPSPVDGILSPDDQISIRFNETINEETVTGNDNAPSPLIEITGVLNNTQSQDFHFTSIFFDGNDNMTIPAMNLGDRSFTIEFWIKRMALGEEILLRKGEGDLLIGIGSDNKPYFKMGETTVVSDSIINDQEWHHLAFVFDQGTGGQDAKQVILFDDGGNTAKSSVINETLNTNSEPIIVGEQFTGNLHELRLWGRVRSAGDIRSNYIYPLSGREAALIGYWPMNEGIGEFAGDKTERRPAQVNATWDFAAGGQAIAFDGMDDHFTITGADLAFNPETDFTLSFWFKGDRGDTVTLFSSGRVENDVDLQTDAWAIQTDENGALFVKNNGTFLPISSRNYFDGQWHHLALTVNRFGNSNVYMDGELSATTDSDNFDGLGGVPLYFGAYGRTIGITTKVSQYFPGEIDEIRIWNLVRRKEQIERDMHFKMRGDEIGLVAYFPFEQYTRNNAVYELTPTLEDFSERVEDLNLNPLASALENGADFTSSTPVIKIQRSIEKVKFTQAINDDQIIITLDEAPSRIENTRLDISIMANGTNVGLEDLFGNKMQSSVTWTAFIDQNRLTWVDDQYEIDLKLDESHEFEAEIFNSGGEAQDFTISNLPTWLKASPSSGRIDPLKSLKIELTIQEGLNIGRYEENIALIGREFDFEEIFSLVVNVTAEAPDWVINPAAFDQSMGFVGILEINDVLSTDENDRIAAFVNDTLRGVANLKYLPVSDNYRVYLNVYSNEGREGTEEIEFRIWDASEGLIIDLVTLKEDQGEPQDRTTFVEGTVLGTQDEPVWFSGNNSRLSILNLKKGWNWISVNVMPADLALDAVLSRFTGVSNDLIKNRNGTYATFDGNTWIGTLNTVDITHSYKIKVGEDMEVPVRGMEIDLSATSIAIGPGWNALAYLGTRRSPVNEALSSFDAQEGDLIKGQFGFAIYDVSEGWVGSLEYLIPSEGYDLKASGIGEVIYPPQAGSKNLGNGEPEPIPGFEIAWHKYAGTMSVIARLSDVKFTSLAEPVLICFDEEGVVVGAARPKGDYYYLTIYGEVDDRSLSFELFDLKSNKSLQIQQQLEFKSDAIVGFPNPLGLDIQTVTSERDLKDESFVKVFPNPFTQEINIQLNISSARNLNLTLTDVHGREISQLKIPQLSTGVNNIRLEPAQKLAPGIFILVIEMDGQRIIRRLIKQ